MSWTFCTSGSAIAKAGTHANSTVTMSGSILDAWCDDAEGRVCAECHTDFVTASGSYTTQIKNAIGDICSSLIAMNIIAYDTTGYLSREADILLNVNDDKASKGLQILKNKEKQRLST